MNYIQANIEFDFKGVRHALSAVIDLDQCMHHADLLTYIYSYMASENGIGSHTYEFDILVMEEIHFDHATGLAADFVCDGRFDIDGFKKAWFEANIVRILQPIASQHLGIDNLDEHPDIKAALIAAYQAK